MALDRNSLSTLARQAAKAYTNPSTSFSYGEEKLSGDAVQLTFKKELDALGATPQLMRENENLIFNLLEESITEILPAKVMQAYSQFADIKHVNDGDKTIFKVNISEASKKRAKQFVTRVGEAGRYETFKLDGYSFEVKTDIYGTAARVEWEEMLRGTITLSDYYSIVLEGLDELIYVEIAKALEAMVQDLKPANFVTSNTFKEQEMDRLIQIADGYGKATIYCTFEFAATMIPADSWKYSDNMKEQLWNNGAFTTYKGHNVVILPQAFTDTNHTEKVIDPSKAYIIPTGSEKPIKIVFEGAAHAKSFENRDWSNEINMYQKFGVASYLVNPGICVYENTTLTKFWEPEQSEDETPDSDSTM